MRLNCLTFIYISFYDEIYNCVELHICVLLVVIEFFCVGEYYRPFILKKQINHHCMQYT